MSPGGIKPAALGPLPQVEWGEVDVADIIDAVPEVRGGGEGPGWGGGGWGFVWLGWLAGWLGPTYLTPHLLAPRPSPLLAPPPSGGWRAHRCTQAPNVHAAGAV